MTPLPGATQWVSTGAQPISTDLGTAVLMVRVGLASNALQNQLRVLEELERLTGIERMNALIGSLIATAGYAFEACRVAQSGMAVLRPLAVRGGAHKDVVAAVGQLIAGKHPAAPFLERGRNELAFHWDEGPVAQHLSECSNSELIWLEQHGDGQGIHRLASTVLLHAFTDATVSALEARGAEVTMRTALRAVDQASSLIRKFFHAATVGYLMSVQATVNTRNAGGSNR